MGSNFYVKVEDIRIDINEDNVYTTCPNCGKEFQVDMGDLLATGDIDLYGTNIYCAECSDNMSGQRD